MVNWQILTMVPSQSVVYVKQVVNYHNDKPAVEAGRSGNRYLIFSQQLHVTVTSVLPHALSVTHTHSVLVTTRTEADSRHRED